MGYYTDYTMTVEGPLKKKEEFENWCQGERAIKGPLKGEYGDLSEHMGALWSGDLDNMKWYNHPDDMRRVSDAFPALKFILIGDGEESDDNWISLFQNGKEVVCLRATSVYKFGDDYISGDKAIEILSRSPIITP